MKIKLTTRLKVALLIFITIEIIGTAGIAILEGPRLAVLREQYDNPIGTIWDTLIDSFWITTTITTGLGAEGYVPSSKLAKLFSSFLSIVGSAVAIGSVVYIFGPIFYGIIKEVSGLGVKVSSLSDHAIICGYNPIAAAAIDEFEKSKMPYVIITRQAKEANNLLDIGLPAVYGDSSNSKMLESVKIDKAKVLLALEDVDTINALIVLTARQLNKSIKIVGKVESEENIEKLMNAGANHVLCPAVVGGREIARISLSMMQGKKVKKVEKVGEKKVPTIELNFPKLK